MVEIVILVFILSAIALAFVACRPHFILYTLAAVVSVVGINIHVGVTFYLFRIVNIVFLISLLLRLSTDKRVEVPSKLLSPYIIVFSFILLFQLVSVLFSAQISDGMTQVFIYASVMTTFVVVIIVGNRLVTITNAVKIYLFSGLVQGLYGVYQVIGFGFGWPTYQSLMVGIPRQANELMVDGYYYSGNFGTFRAAGFFQNDVSHYAGYMVGILLVGIALIVHNRGLFWPYLVVFFGGMGLIFSLSRSGLVAFFVFGLPTLIFLLSRVNRATKKRGRSFVATLFLILVPVGVLMSQAPLSSLGIKLPNVTEIMSKRLFDLVNPGGSTGSMEAHITTRLTGLDAWASSPLIGVGLGVNASPWYSEYYQRGWAGSHSHHLDVLGETGIIGAGLQFLFMMIVGKYMWRGLFITREPSLERHLLAGLLAAYIAILFGNFLYRYFLFDFVWFLMAIGVALSRLLILDARKKESCCHS